VGHHRQHDPRAVPVGVGSHPLPGSGGAVARARRIDVPRDVALIGLENDPSLYHHGLTRCDPDFESIGYLMAHALIGDFAVPTDRAGILPNRAYMVEKATTP